LQANIDIVINDRDWPELTMYVKLGPAAEKVQVRYDAATASFVVVVSKFVKQAVDTAIERRKTHGS